MNLLFDWVLLLTNVSELSATNFVLLVLGLWFVRQILFNCTIKPVLIINMQLILESISPVLLLWKCFYRVYKIVFKESLCKIKTLQFLDSLELLLSFHPSSVQGLSFESDTRKFFFDFLLPLRLFSHSAFMIALLEFFDRIHFMLLFNLKSCLLNSLA